jgi:hypothetical protein
LSLADLLPGLLAVELSYYCQTGEGMRTGAQADGTTVKFGKGVAKIYENFLLYFD